MPTVQVEATVFTGTSLSLVHYSNNYSDFLHCLGTTSGPFTQAATYNQLYSLRSSSGVTYSKNQVFCRFDLSGLDPTIRLLSADLRFVCPEGSFVDAATLGGAGFTLYARPTDYDGVATLSTSDYVCHSTISPAYGSYEFATDFASPQEFFMDLDAAALSAIESVRGSSDYFVMALETHYEGYSLISNLDDPSYIQIYRDSSGNNPVLLLDYEFSGGMLGVNI